MVRHPETKELLVNLDPLIYQVIEESVNMTKMQLPVPRDAQLLLYSKQKLRCHHSLLLQVLKDNKEIRATIEEFSQSLFNTSLKKVSPQSSHNSNNLITTFESVLGMVFCSLTELFASCYIYFCAFGDVIYHSKHFSNIKIWYNFT